ncbi:MAG: ATP-binding cassette domain-containing protein [Clostridia bacterium]|nr:ATP-binding cassette domain-containing protein [Clostridia bacterium]
MQLSLSNIEKSFGEKKVLKQISFSAESGEAFGLLGRNGAGKTTSIRILMNVFPADAGEVLVDSKPIDYSKTKIGYLPEERGLYPKKIIFEQLVYLALLKGMGKKDAEKSVEYWLERLDMSEYKNKKLDTLSKGNQQKIQLITALAHDPDIIILDEPFSGLDPVNAMLLKDVVKEQIAKGKIVLFSSHQMNYIEEFCDRIAILNDGQVAVSGRLSDIKRSYPRNRLTVKSQKNSEIAKAFENAVFTDDGALLIRMHDEAEKSDVMKRLVSEWDVDAVEVFEPTLSDIFVQYAGDAPVEG